VRYPQCPAYSDTTPNSVHFWGFRVWGNADLFGLVFLKLHIEICIYDNLIEIESFGSEFLVPPKHVSNVFKRMLGSLLIILSACSACA
jgi:hypothetical protein